MGMFPERTQDVKPISTGLEPPRVGHHQADLRPLLVSLAGPPDNGNAFGRMLMLYTLVDSEVSVRPISQL